MDTIKLSSKLNDILALKDYRECAIASRSLLGEMLEHIFSATGVTVPPKSSMLERIDHPAVVGYISNDETIGSLHYVRMLGRLAEHQRKVQKKEALLATQNISNLLDIIKAKESGTVYSVATPGYMTEAATRKIYIDQKLEEAGWDVLEKKGVILPARACIEIEVDGMPFGTKKGYCDYVLYGKDGKPLAIVEAKKTSVAIDTGRHQVDLYGECMKAVYGYKPILYYTNGYKIMMIDGLYPDRPVSGYHTIDELELLLQQRNRKPISKITIDDEITNRPYQKIAITKMCERLNAHYRRGLLVMATGTGKTRVAISLVDVLTKNNWVKNVLFLADRTSLVHQAKESFAKYMPHMPICELSACGEHDKDYNAHLIFCTYQSMIHYIDEEEKTFPIGRFDLIIIDEAHRSIFNKYGSIFRYFDSFLVGLTATPKNEVDTNTYKIFDCEAGEPNFDYSLDDAIKDHYLVGYDVIPRTSAILTTGISYSALTEEQKAQLDEYLEIDPSTPDFTIPGNEIFKILFNKSTCQRVIEELMLWGLRVEGGETIGKTIIFAYNHHHAQMIVDSFKTLFPSLPANTCQLVDYSISYAEDLVGKFKMDDEFRIAVSVDMLDTGIDVPETLNLVFFKPVRSKIKFVQMIGRGTRLCPDIYGLGKNKSGFQIFDYCGNFEYFHYHAEGKEGKQHLSLSQRLFNTRVEIKQKLQSIEYMEDPYFSHYHDELKNLLYGHISSIKSESYKLQVFQEMSYVDKYHSLDKWVNISPVEVKEIQKHLSPLLPSGIDGSYLSVAFDLRMLNVEKSIIITESILDASDDIKNIRKSAKYLLENKASIPAVKSKATELKQLVSESFWYGAKVSDLETLRSDVRSLMEYLKDGSRPPIDIDIPDTITESEFKPGSTMIDIRTYREKVLDYLAENTDNAVIRKIQNLERINNSDLDELEKILWSELGTETEYHEATTQENLAAFIRSLVGITQEAVNEKFGAYLSEGCFNSMQQEYIHSVINYVRENGDIELTDIVNTEPFSEYDVNDIFGVNIPALVEIVSVLHDSIVAA